MPTSNPRAITPYLPRDAVLGSLVNFNPTRCRSSSLTHVRRGDLLEWAERQGVTVWLLTSTRPDILPYRSKNYGRPVEGGHHASQICLVLAACCSSARDPLLRVGSSDLRPRRPMHHMSGRVSNARSGRALGSDQAFGSQLYSGNQQYMADLSIHRWFQRHCCFHLYQRRNRLDRSRARHGWSESGRSWVRDSCLRKAS